MRRRLVLVAMWLAGTAFAMVLAAFAVQLASAKVTDHPTAVISRPQLEQELTNARAASTTTAAPTPTPTSTEVDATGDGAGATSGQIPGEADSDDTAVTVTPGAKRTTTTTARLVVPSTSVDDHGGPPSTGESGGGPGPSPTSVPATVLPTEQQFAMLGGWVRVRCEGAVVSLVGSSPASGFTMEVKDTGPQSVEVRFFDAAHESRFKARCDGGQIVPEQRESDL